MFCCDGGTERRQTQQRKSREVQCWFFKMAYCKLILMICEQTAQEWQNKEHKRICSDSTVPINPDDTTMVWRVGGHRICCTRSEWQVQLFVSECYRFLIPPKKVKASPHNALIPFIRCCMENGCWISKSVVPDLFPAVRSAVASSLFLLLSVLPPSHASSKAALLPFPLQPITFLLTGIGSVPFLGSRGHLFIFLVLSQRTQTDELGWIQLIVFVIFLIKAMLQKNWN